MKAGGIKMPKRLAYDRGGRGAKEVRGVAAITQGKPQKRDSAYDRRMKRHRFRRRAGGGRAAYRASEIRPIVQERRISRS